MKVKTSYKILERAKAKVWIKFQICRVWASLNSLKSKGGVVGEDVEQGARVGDGISGVPSSKTASVVRVVEEEVTEVGLAEVEGW